jgi:hypothetical protein
MRRSVPVSRNEVQAARERARNGTLMRVRWPRNNDENP